MDLTVLGLGGHSVFMEVNAFHRPGETVRAHSIYAEPGGKGYNQAVAARRLGASVLFLGAMGDDREAEACKAFLENEHITPCIQTVKDAATAYACILTDAQGENRVTVYSGAADRLSAAFVDKHEEQIAQSRMLLLNHECPLEANLAAAGIARDHNIPIVINPAPIRQTHASLLREAWILTPNFQEACALLGLPETADNHAISQAAAKQGYARMVVTLGKRGAMVIEDGKAVCLPALPCKSVDTTGAGDCFTAALAVALLDGAVLKEAAEFAVLASGVSVQHRHVMPGLPFRQDILKRGGTP